MNTPKSKSLSVVCILLMLLIASELFLDGQKLAASRSISNWLSAGFHALMFLSALFTFSQKKWARKMLLVFSVFQLCSFAFGFYALNNPKSNIGKSTFSGYVEGYIERQKANGASPETYTLTDQKLNELWQGFEKEIWPKARTPLMAVIGCYSAIYLALLVFLMQPKIKSQFV